MGMLIAIALKSLIVAGGALLVLKLASRRSAADRSLIAHLGLLAVLLLPLGSMLLPPLGVAGPAFLAGEPTVVADPVAEAPSATPVVDLTAAATAIEAAPASPLANVDLPILLYGLPALVLAALTLVAIVRLMSLKARANVLVEPQWLTALARAQQRMGFKHGTALLTSNELPSPISWGVVRPIILLNEEAAQAHGQAEAVIAHELAHVAHLDWAKLLLSRIVVALFWFNPLVWLLAREAHQLREEAADDAVLAANIEDTDYAQLLVGVARHECRGLLLGAHGVAPAKNSLARRVRRVLDGALERAPGGWRWTSAAAFFAAGMAVPLAALTVVPGVQPVPAPGPSTHTAVPPAATGALPAAEAEADVREPVEPLEPAKEAKAGNEIVRTRDGTTLLAGPGRSISYRADGSVAVAENSGRSILYDADGTTYVSEANGNSTVYRKGKVVARAIATGSAERVVDERLDRAIEMRAVGATPDYAKSIRGALPGVRISDRQLIELKAVGVSKSYIMALKSLGYRGLDVPTLVELRALQVTPGEIQRIKKSAGRLPTVSEVVKIKAVGVVPEDLDPDDGS